MRWSWSENGQNGAQRKPIEYSQKYPTIFDDAVRKLSSNTALYCGANHVGNKGFDAVLFHDYFV